MPSTPSKPNNEPADPAEPSRPEPDEPVLPRREIRDAGALRALAHPLRFRLLELLALDGPATATELSERVDESPANCSWHLRQLRKYGYVEQTEGAGRQRPWQWIPRSTGWSEADDDPELAEAGARTTAVLVEHEVNKLRSWQLRQHAEPNAWRSAAFVMQSATWLTAEELEELTAGIDRLVNASLERLVDPTKRPPNARLIRFFAWGVPDEDH